jgi:hypothetical protein
MVGVAAGLQELVRLTLLDYLTCEILIDAFVDPQTTVYEWRTRHSGVNARRLQEAKATGVCLDSWEAARSQVLEYIDSDTIIIGQALNNDLKILRLVHTNVFDSGLLVKRRINLSFARSWGLRGLCEELLQIAVQRKDSGHDPLEDCLATREIVLWMTRNREAFEAWVDKQRASEKAKRKEVIRLAEERRKAKEEARMKELEEKMERMNEGIISDSDLEREKEYQGILREEYGLE